MQIDILETGRFDPSDVDEQTDHPWKLKSRWGTAFSKEGFCSTFFVLFSFVVVLFFRCFSLLSFCFSACFALLLMCM